MVYCVPARLKISGKILAGEDLLLDPLPLGRCTMLTHYGAETRDKMG